MQKAELTSFDTLVQSPFVIAKIGDYTFGSYSSEGKLSKFGSPLIVKYPNFIESLVARKVNGEVNTYTLTLSYAISVGDDPNLLEKIFSTAGSDWTMYLSYGDWAAPGFIYREEKTIITAIKSNADFTTSKIIYTIEATSDSISLVSSVHNFPAMTTKASDAILDLVLNPTYGFNKVFTGMKNRSKILSNGLIPRNDKPVRIEAQNNTSAWARLNYLVDCMSVTPTNTSVLQDSIYVLNVFDDRKNNLGGTYFKIVEIGQSNNSSLDTYSVDVGFPGDNFITDFKVNNDNSYSILYDEGESIKESEYVYKLDNNGNLITQYSPAFTRNSLLNKTTQATKAWWTRMTSFPIEATLTLKGVTRPAILMTYVDISVMFYGAKHYSSGRYIITGQTDTINARGCTTELKLLRIKGET